MFCVSKHQTTFLILTMLSISAPTANEMFMIEAENNNNQVTILQQNTNENNNTAHLRDPTSCSCNEIFSWFKILENQMLTLSLTNHEKEAKECLFF